MIYDVIIADQAQEDIRGIFEYIAFELMSPQNAAGQIGRIEKSISSLETLPHRYRTFEREPWHSRGLRVLPADNFVVLYIPDENRRTVTIIRVMYGGRDTGKWLGKN